MRVGCDIPHPSRLESRLLAFDARLTDDSIKEDRGMAEKRIHARIDGYVQGVGFRYFAVDVAEELGLTGWVRNTPDGGVEVVAEGEEGRLARFIGMLRQGPRRAEVDDVKVEWQEPRGEFRSFQVRR